MERTKRKMGRGRKPPSRYIKTGCTTLDQVTGRYVLGRVFNIVGDKSTGKTLLAIEACANFAAAREDGLIFYREAEEAFDKPYAASLGMPLDRISFWDDDHDEDEPLDTVEAFFKDLKACAMKCIKEKVAGLYILDSLDALSDEDEMKQDGLGKSGYGITKPAEMSRLFRKITRLLSKARLCLVIISQIRDKMNAMFGRKTSRSGGRAMDFYCSWILYLTHTERMTQTKNGIKRVIGVRVKAQGDKNKIAKPFRECEFMIRFDYGIDDLEACLSWLMENKMLGRTGLSDKEAKRLIASSDQLDKEDYNDAHKPLVKTVKEVWNEIETSFLPKRKKY